MTPAIIVGNGMLLGSVVASEEWRKHGEIRRKLLLKQDEMEGGTSFEINRKCCIQRYFKIGDRVRVEERIGWTNTHKRERKTHTHAFCVVCLLGAYSVPLHVRDS